MTIQDYKLANIKKCLKLDFDFFVYTVPIISFSEEKEFINSALYLYKSTTKYNLSGTIKHECKFKLSYTARYKVKTILHMLYLFILFIAAVLVIFAMFGIYTINPIISLILSGAISLILSYITARIIIYKDIQKRSVVKEIYEDRFGMENKNKRRNRFIINTMINEINKNYTIFWSDEEYYAFVAKLEKI